MRTHRRWQAVLILSLAFLAVVASAAIGWWYARESPPHQGPILLISVDQLSPAAVGTYSGSKSDTAAIDALAADGIVFDHAYAEGVQLLPSHVSLMTGQFPFQHGVRDDAGFTLKADARTLAEVLKNRGFNTGAAVSSFLLRRENGVAQGFTFYDAEIPDAETGPRALERPGAETIDAAEKWARAQTSQRYFLMLEVNARDADAAVRRFTDLFRERRLYDKSTIVLVGDRTATETPAALDDAALQVPLVVKQPDNEGAGRRITDAVQQVDLLPTILDFVRAPIPGGVRGHSLRAVLDSERVHLTPAPIYAEWLAPYFRFGGRPLYRGADADADRAIEGPAPIAAADEDLLAKVGYLPGLFPSAAPTIDLPDTEQLAIAGAHYQAALLAGERKFSGAIRLLQGIVSRHPDLAPVHYQLGLLLVRSGRTEEALDAFRTAAELRPDAVDIPVAFADALLRLNRLADAAAQAEEAVSLITGAPPARVAAAHAIAARVAIARKDADTAMEHAAAAEKADPAVPMQKFVRGRLLFDEGRFDEALGPLEETVTALQRTGAALPDAHLYLGETLTRLDRASEAETELRDELRAFPHNLRAYASLAMLYRAADRDADMEDVIDELVESTSTPEGYAMAARLWTALGERSRAEALRSDARTRFRGDPSLALLGRDARQ
jgi:tetratricopeptide (TPR) repeat protein